MDEASDFGGLCGAVLECDSADGVVRLDDEAGARGFRFGGGGGCGCALGVGFGAEFDGLDGVFGGDAGLYFGPGNVSIAVFVSSLFHLLST